MKVTWLCLFILLLAGFACDRKPMRPSFGNSNDATSDGNPDAPLPEASDDLHLATPVVHRMNRNEYNNAVLDVFGMDLQLAYDFPEDPVTHGFDNVGGNLSLSPALTELMSQAAIKIANKVVDDHPRSDIDIDPSLSGKGQNGSPLGRQWSIEGTMQNTFTLEYDEAMTFSVLLGGEAYRAETPKATIKLDDATIGDYEITAESNYPKSIDFKVDLKKGDHVIAISFNNQSIRDAVDPRFNYLILSRITGRSDVMVESKMVRDLKACTQSGDLECKHEIYREIAKKAWRRPLSVEEKNELKTLWESTVAAKGTDADAMRTVIHAITLSTKFLFRAVNPVKVTKEKAPIDDYSIASRLSFFLWSSVPDEELLNAAAKSELRNAANLRAQIKRMLTDPKSNRFIKNFASQWLYTRPLDKASPDPTVFPNFSASLKNSMALESEYVFGDFLTNGKDINELLSPGFTFVDDKLAKHYGLTPPGSNELKKVRVPNNERGGVLTHGAWLTVTSLPNDTMPVKRGVWVMENLICKTVPAPPAVPPLEQPAAGSKPETVRERFARHLKDPTCAGCHNLIDPIGYGLEGFDAVGAMRSMDSVGKPVDTKGQMFGVKFDDFTGMVKALKEGEDFKNCLTRKLFSYALGRVAESEDEDALKDIANEMANNGASLEDVIEYIVLSPAFRMADFSEDL